MKYLTGDRELDVQAERHQDGTMSLTLPSGERRRVGVKILPDGALEITDGERVFIVASAQGEKGEVLLGFEGQSWSFAPSLGRRAAQAKRSGSLTSPMAGIVVKVHVSVGDAVVAYQPLAVVEAMKVMATLEAPFSGTVTAVNAANGDRVEQDVVLIELKPG